MFNILTKLTTTLTRKSSMQKVMFILVGVQTVLKFLVSTKILGQYKKFALK